MTDIDIESILIEHSKNLTYLMEAVAVHRRIIEEWSKTFAILPKEITKLFEELDGLSHFASDNVSPRLLDLEASINVKRTPIDNILYKNISLESNNERKNET